MVLKHDSKECVIYYITVWAFKRPFLKKLTSTYFHTLSLSDGQLRSNLHPGDVTQAARQDKLFQENPCVTQMGRL